MLMHYERLASRPGVFFLLLIAFSFPFSSAAQAKPRTTHDAPRLIEMARTRHLANHATWLRLLHYNKEGEQSDVNSPAFFLAPDGRTDPEAEMAATIRALFGNPSARVNDEHPRCRFPARYMWLSKQLGLSGEDSREPRCRALERWARFDDIRSVSVMFVSGYFGNPASSFGHSLLRFNSSDARDPATLFDLTFNFGATIPEGELTAVYIYKGLTGGYQSGFSDRYFYTEDMVYLRTEFRDMWSYELELDQEQQRFLVLHLWEIVGKKFTYYFLTENCAFRIAEVVELAKGISLTKRSRAWYAPIELFLRLHELDRASPGSVIRSVTFIPSDQRILHAKFRTLTSRDREAANRIIKTGTSALQDKLAGHAEQSRIDISDALLAYYDYRIRGAQPDPPPALVRSKRDVLGMRLQLPPHDQGEAEAVRLPSPASGPGPMLAAGGIGWNDSTGDAFGVLEWSALHQDPLDDNGQSHGELVVGDAVLTADAGDLTLRKLDFIRIRKFDQGSSPIYGESDWSWRARVGLERQTHNGKYSTDLLADAGIGSVFPGGNSTFGYIMLDGSVGTGIEPAFEPNIGIITHLGPWKTWLRGGLRYTEEEGAPKNVGHMDMQYRIDRRYAVRLSIESRFDRRAALSLRSYW